MELAKSIDLNKRLPRIAARVLHNTHCIPKNLKFKFELISQAYGGAAVEEDFEKWCRENFERNPRYPITEYMKVVDQRLGTATEEQKPDTKDPRIGEISSLCYDLTGVLPSVKGIAEVLTAFEPDEIKAALAEYADTLDEKDAKSGVKAFFSEGGAAAVILSRRKRQQ